MRLGVVLLTLSLSLVLTTPGDAQFNLGSRPVQFKPVDTSRAMQPSNLQGMIPQGPTVKPFSRLTNFFSRISLPTFGSKPVSAPILTPDKNPFQPNPPKGKFIIEPKVPTGKSIFDFAFVPKSR